MPDLELCINGVSMQFLTELAWISILIKLEILFVLVSNKGKAIYSDDLTSGEHQGLSRSEEEAA